MRRQIHDLRIACHAHVVPLCAIFRFHPNAREGNPRQLTGWRQWHDRDRERVTKINCWAPRRLFRHVYFIIELARGCPEVGMSERSDLLICNPSWDLLGDNAFRASLT
ncbi:hypothetical protein J6590_050302 [Homalodisca vitripennis]|nr:hypothetical protein J6590_050302 [Homalodisca vitripennis]